MAIGFDSRWASLNVANHITSYTNKLENSVGRITSGMRINTAADDPAGLTVSEKIRDRIGALDQSAQNAQNDSAVLKAADNAYSEAVDILQRMKELATEASDPVLESDGRAGLNAEYSVLTSRLGDIQSNTKFGSLNLFAGTDGLTAGLAFVLGADAATSFTASVAESQSITTTGITVTAITDAAEASSAIGALDTALSNLLAGQAIVGGYENALGFISEGIQSESVAMQNAHTTAFDTDIAREMTQYVKNSVLLQSSQLILSQQNQNAYSVLNLLSN